MQAYTYILYSCQISNKKFIFKLNFYFINILLLETEVGVRLYRDGIICVWDGFNFFYFCMLATDFGGYRRNYSVSIRDGIYISSLNSLETKDLATDLDPSLFPCLVLLVTKITCFRDGLCPSLFSIFLVVDK